MPSWHEDFFVEMDLSEKRIGVADVLNEKAIVLDEQAISRALTRIAHEIIEKNKPQMIKDAENKAIESSNKIKNCV